LFGSGGDISFLNENSETSHDVLALILVEIKESLEVKSESLVKDWLDEFREH
jgi:hypothetical protein